MNQRPLGPHPSSYEAQRSDPRLQDVEKVVSAVTGKVVGFMGLTDEAVAIIPELEALLARRAA